MKILIPETDFLKKLTPFLGSIYIDTSIFTRSIIISVKIEISLPLNVQQLENSGYIFHCHECAHHFKTKEQFVEHISLYHMVSKKLFHLYTDLVKEESNFQCYICNVKKKDKQALTRHVMKDHYEYKENLLRHVNSVPKQINRHTYTYCGKSFRRKGTLTVHIQSGHEEGQSI